jgi:hypothetical protein
LPALIWPVSHHLADAELVGRHFVSILAVKIEPAAKRLARTTVGAK